MSHRITKYFWELRRHGILHEMHVIAIKTPKITPEDQDILAVLDAALPSLTEGDIVAVTSKIVSICEGSVVPTDTTNKEALIRQEAEHYLPGDFSRYNYHFAVKHHTLAGSAGVDESNGSGHFILWPRDPQTTANTIWQHLRNRHGLQSLGIIITDSTSQPMRRGAIGIALAHSGFVSLRRYVGQPDLFGRPFVAEHANVSGGLAATAVFAMGEGSEQTPLCVISGAPNIEFQQRTPSLKELDHLHLTLETDVYAPFFTNAPWQNGPR